MNLLQIVLKCRFWLVKLQWRPDSPNNLLVDGDAGERSSESLGCRKIKPGNSKANQPWIFIGRTDIEVEAPILWPPDEKSRLIGKRPCCWERLRAGGEGGNRGWDGWMASYTQWALVWANSGRQWKTRKPGMLQSMELQRVGHDLATKQQ